MNEQNREQSNVLTVSQLTGLIRTMLENSFSGIQLKGEISNFRPNSTGHLYFALKDNDSKISAVMFRGKAASLDFQPKDGMLVQVKGSVSVYGPQGNYQIIISSMTKAGTGDIMEMIEERKKKLAAEGLFDSERKRRLPFFPKTVGVVTSATGAALRDILQITGRRNDKVNVIVLPAIVQGEGAAESLIKMIRAANIWKLCDVLIVGRGGGSLEDLLPFSDEQLVRTIASSEIPVISAVGHEIDWALSDYAADVRAPTPSAAAELAVPRLEDIMNNIAYYRDELFNSVENRIQRLRMMLNTYDTENMELQFRRIEQPLLMRFENAQRELKDSMQKLLDEKRQNIANCVQVLENCNPQTILDRGYSMVTDGEGKIIRSSSELTENAKIIIRPAKGRISATVTEISE